MNQCHTYYDRVIPRDLFNEASLLKCYGQVYLKLEGHRSAGFEEVILQSFDVVQRESDGFLYIRNLELIIDELYYRLVRPLNSRVPWPLYVERIDDDDFESIPVFTDDGELSEQMLRLCGEY